MSSEKSDKSLSKTLSWLLRHGAIKEGLQIKSDGFIVVEQILNHKSLKGKFNRTDIERIVKNNDKQRFNLRRSENCLEIRANQGHSLKIVENLGLKPISANFNGSVIHGTFLKHLESIKKIGLSRLTRNHIHFAVGLPKDKSVISGIRRNCQVLIFIDIKKAINDSLEFFQSTNGVILSAGNEQGIIEPKYFARIEQNEWRKHTINTPPTLFIRGFPPNINQDVIKDFLKTYGTFNKLSFGHNNTEIYVSFNDSKAMFDVAHYSLNFFGLLLNVSWKCTEGETNDFRNKLISLLKTKTKFSDHMTILEEYLQPSPEHLMQKYRMIYNGLQSILQNIYPKCTVHLFGSVILGLNTSLSDLDLFVELYDTNYQLTSDEEKQHLSKIRNLLYKSSMFRNICLIAEARVPIITCTHYGTNLKCDINIKNKLCIQNTKLLAYYINRSFKLRKVMFALKHWTSCNQTNNGVKRCLFPNLTSYALCVLFVFYLQQTLNFPSVESLQKGCSEFLQNGWNCAFAPDLLFKSEQLINMPIFQLFRGFFQFYASFDFEENVICPFIGKTLKKTDFLNVNNLPDSYVNYKKIANLGPNFALNLNTAIVVQDPFEHNRNIMCNFRYLHFFQFYSACNLMEIVCKETESFLNIMESINKEMVRNYFIKMKDDFEHFESKVTNKEEKNKEISLLWFHEVKDLLEKLWKDIALCPVNSRTQKKNEIMYVFEAICDVWSGRKKVKVPENSNRMNKEMEISRIMKCDVSKKFLVPFIFKLKIKCMETPKVHIELFTNYFDQVRKKSREKLFIEHSIEFILQFLNDNIYTLILEKDATNDMSVACVKESILETSSFDDVICIEPSIEVIDICDDDDDDFNQAGTSKDVKPLSIQIENKELYKIGFASPSELRKNQNKKPIFGHSKIGPQRRRPNRRRKRQTVGLKKTINDLIEKEKLEKSLNGNNVIEVVNETAVEESNETVQESYETIQKSNEAIQTNNEINEEIIETNRESNEITEINKNTNEVNNETIQNTEISQEKAIEETNNENLINEIINSKRIPVVVLSKDNLKMSHKMKKQIRDAQRRDSYLKKKESEKNLITAEKLRELYHSTTMNYDQSESGCVPVAESSINDLEIIESSENPKEMNSESIGEKVVNEEIEEEDVPADFFDDFSNQDFMAGLDIVDAWDENEKTKATDTERKSTNKENDKPSRSTSKTKKSSSVKHVESRSPKRRRLRSPLETKRHHSSTNRGRSKSPEMRRDPEKTRRDINRDKLQKEQKIVSDKLKIVETGLVPPGTEMECDLNSISKLTKIPTKSSIVEKRQSPIVFNERKQSRERRYRRSSSKDRRRYSRSRSPDYYHRSRHKRRSSSFNLDDTTNRWMRKQKKRSRSRDMSRSKIRNKSDIETNSQNVQKKKTFLEEIRDKLNQVHPPMQQYPHHHHQMYSNPVMTPVPVPAPNQFIPLQNNVGIQQYDQQFFIGDSYTLPSTSSNVVVNNQLPTFPILRNPSPIPVIESKQLSPPPPPPITLPLDINNEKKGTVVKKTVDVSNIDKLFAEKKISLSDFLSITAKPEVHSSGPKHLQKKIGVISRCQEVIKILTEEKKFSGRLQVIQSTSLENRLKTSDKKYESPLRKIPVVRFQFTTPLKQNEEGDPFAASLDRVLRKIGILKETVISDESVDNIAKTVVGSSFADENTTPIRISPVKQTINNTNNIKISEKQVSCDECKKRKSIIYTDIGTQCIDTNLTYSVSTQVCEDDLNQMKGKKESIALLTPAQLLGKDKAKEDEMKTTLTKDVDKKNEDKVTPQNQISKPISPSVRMKKQIPPPPAPLMSRREGRGRGGVPIHNFDDTRPRPLLGNYRDPRQFQHDNGRESRAYQHDNNSIRTFQYENMDYRNQPLMVDAREMRYYQSDDLDYPQELMPSRMYPDGVPPVTARLGPRVDDSNGPFNEYSQQYRNPDNRFGFRY